LKHKLADFVDLLAKTSIKSTYCQHFWNEKSVSDSLPRYGSQNRIAAMISYKMVVSKLAVEPLLVSSRCQDIDHRRCQNMPKVTHHHASK